MPFSITKSHRDRAAQIRLEQAEIERNYKMKELISIASKNGMK